MHIAKMDANIKTTPAPPGSLLRVHDDAHSLLNTIRNNGENRMFDFEMRLKKFERLLRQHISVHIEAGHFHVSHALDRRMNDLRRGVELALAFCFILPGISVHPTPRDPGRASRSSKFNTSASVFWGTSSGTGNLLLVRSVGRKRANLMERREPSSCCVTPMVVVVNHGVKGDQGTFGSKYVERLVSATCRQLTCEHANTCAPLYPCHSLRCNCNFPRPNHIKTSTCGFLVCIAHIALLVVDIFFDKRHTKTPSCA